MYFTANRSVRNTPTPVSPAPHMRLPDPLTAAPAPIFTFDPNVSVGLCPPLVAELREPQDHIPGDKYYIVTVGTEVGIFQNWGVASAHMRPVSSGAMKAKKSWQQAVAYYSDCLERNSVHVRDADAQSSLSPGNVLERPIRVLSASPTPEPTFAQFNHFRALGPTTPTPAAKVPSAAAMKVRKRKDAPQPPPLQPALRRSINSGANTSDDDAYVVGRARSSSVAVTSGPIPVIKPAPRPKDVVHVPGSSEDEAMSASTVKKGKQPSKALKKAPKKLDIITPRDVGLSVDVQHATDLKRADELKRVADIKHASDLKYASELIRAADLRHAADLEHAAALKQAAALKHAAYKPAGHSYRSRSPAPAHYAHTSGAASTSSSVRMGSTYAHLDGKNASDVFSAQASMDGKSIDAHMGAQSDDEYHYSDWSLDKAGDEELTHALTNPLVPTASKYKVLGQLRKLEMQKAQTEK